MGARASPWLGYASWRTLPVLADRFKAAAGRRRPGPWISALDARNRSRRVDDIVLARHRAGAMLGHEHEIRIAVAGIPLGVVDLPGIDVERALADDELYRLGVRPGLRAHAEVVALGVLLT